MNDSDDTLPVTIWEALASGDASDLQNSRKALSFVRGERVDENATPSIAPFIMVVDANQVWREISHFVQITNRLTPLIETAKAGICAYHAPVWLETELKTSVLPSLARRLGVSQRELRCIYEEFVRPHLLLNTRYSTPRSKGLGAQHDPDDEPYIRLARDIGALGVISEDRDIDRFLMRRLSKQEVTELRRLARLENGIASTKMIGLMGGWLSVGTTSEVIKAAPALARKIPKQAYPYIALAGLAGLGWLAFTEHGRKQSKMLGNISYEGIKSAGKFVGEGMIWTMETEREAAALRKQFEAIETQR